MRRKQSWWVLSSLGVVLAGHSAGGCGEEFGSCLESRTCAESASVGGSGAGEPGQIGAAGFDGLGGLSDVSPGGIGGAGVPSIGGGGEGGDEHAGGAGGDSAGAAPVGCSDGYTDWFKSSFSFPNGDVVGTADFPSMPWSRTGILKIDAGRLSGIGTVVTSQGARVPAGGARLRFRARFTDSEQLVTAAFNAGPDGSGGIRVSLSSAGTLTLTEGKTTVGASELAPLETGADWFVEAIFSDVAAQVSVARANYGTEKQAKVEASLSSRALESSAEGKAAFAQLASTSGIGPVLDELSVARCGVLPPEYQPLLVDTFERPDTTTIGKAEFPPTSAWTTSGAVRIVNGALESKSLGNATIPLKVSTSGLRIRTTLRLVSGPSAYLWADVNYNVQAGAHGIDFPGFWVWGGPVDGSFYTGIFRGAHGETKQAAQLAPEVSYFVELDRDGDLAVLVVRTQSFAGPILAVDSNSGLAAKPDPGVYFTLGDEGGGGTLFEDIRLDSYAGQL